MNKKLMFSSETDQWSTPQYLYDRLNLEYGFRLDPCASHENHKCDVYFTEADDGLSKDWSGLGPVFMNPPYGRTIGKWVRKAYESGELVVCLLPARTNTSWWHDYCAKAVTTEFIRGRLKFGNAVNSAPFPSVIVVFGGTNG